MDRHQTQLAQHDRIALILVAFQTNVADYLLVDFVFDYVDLLKSWDVHF
jgi:hypothetical protein